MCVILGLLWLLFARNADQYLIREEVLKRADAIVCLSGSSAYRERTGQAAILYRNGAAPIVLLTNDGEQGGWDPEEERNPYYFERARRELIRQGVPEYAIEVLEPVVAGTADEARMVVKASRERGFNSILLVTSPHHSRRALMTFGKVSEKGGRDLKIGLIAAYPYPDTELRPTWWLSPSGWRDVAGEYIKLVYYRAAL